MLLWLGAPTLALWAGPAEDQFAVAALHYRRARWQMAVDEFRTFIDLHRDHARIAAARYYLGESLVQLGDNESARRAFQEFLERHPADDLVPQAGFRVGEANYLLGDYEKARDILSQFQQSHSEHDLNRFALPYLGEINLALSRPEAARDCFSKALSQFPELSRAEACRFGIGRAFEQLGEDKQALRFYRFVVQQRSDALADDALIRIATLLHKQGKYDAALESLEDFQRDFADSPLLTHAQYWQGVCYRSLGDEASAIDELQVAAATDPASHLLPAILFELGEACRSTGQMARAKKAFQSVIGQHGDSQWADDACQVAMRIALETGQFDQVELLGEQFAARYADSPLRALALQMQGRAKLKQKQFSAALDLLATAESEIEQRVETQGTAANGGQNQEKLPINPRVFSRSNTYYWALACLGQGQFEAARQKLQSIDLAAGSDSLRHGVRVATASIAIGLGEYAAAIEPLEVCLQSEPDGPDAANCLAQLCLAYAETDDLKKAREHFARLQTDHPEHQQLPATALHLAERVYEREDWLAAQRLFETAAVSEDQPTIAKALSGWAWSALQADDATTAIDVFQRLLAQHPLSEPAAEAAMTVATTLEQQAKWSTALTHYQIVVDRYPDSEFVADASFGAASMQRKLDNDQAAVQLFRDLLVRFPDFKRQEVVHYELAWLLMELQQTQDALDHFRIVNREYPGSQFWGDATYRLAEEAVRAGEDSLAGEYLGALIEADSSGSLLGPAHYLRGKIAVRSSRWQDAAQAMQLVLETSENLEIVLPAKYWIAEASYRLDDLAAAGKAFDELAQQVADREDAWQAVVPLRRAQIRATRKQWREALEIASAIQDDFPDFGQQYEVDYVLGRCYASQARFQEARAAFQRVIDSKHGGGSETAAMAQWMIGETYFQQQRHDLAIRNYFRVEALFPYPRWQAAALLQAGKCYEAQGQQDAAARVYEQIVQEYPTTIFIADAKERLTVVKELK